MSAAATLIALGLLAAEPDPRAEADRLVAEGATLGQKGQWDEAIARFEAADAVFPRAIHACNIGLAHVRAGRPEKALVQLGACQVRATEPLPSWVGKRIEEARATLLAGDYAPLELMPDTPGARVRVPHFGDQVFTPPVTVWLPLGAHALHAEAPGYEPLDEALTVASKAALRRVVSLSPRVVEAPEPPPEPGPEPTPEPAVESVASARPDAGVAVDDSDPQLPAWIVLATGGAALATGAIFYGLALDSKAEAEGFVAGSPDFASANSTFATQRDLAYGFLVGGAVATAAGVVLVFVLDDTDDVAVTPTVGGVLARVRF